MIETYCYPCLCRKCDYLPGCDVGDITPMHPCKACGRATYITDYCVHQEGRAGIDPAEVVGDFNIICVDLPVVRSLTDARRKAIMARKITAEQFRDVFYAVQQSDYLTGRNGKWRRCSFDWILKPNNFAKIQEGLYKNTRNDRAEAQPKSMQYPQRRVSEEEIKHLFTNLDD